MKLLIPFIVGIQVFILVPTVRSDVKSCYNFAHFSATSIITCYDRHGKETPCTDQLLEGAVAKQRCRDNFHPDQKVETNDYNATCKDGVWDKKFFNCIPSCGKAANNAIGLLAGGKPETRGGSPWYVAIYSSEETKTPEFICGGTLINEELVVSAAHCFYDETFRVNKDHKFFHAIVAKATQNYKNKDYESTKTYQFKEIFFPRTFKGSLTGFASDIVIIQLTEKVTFSRDIFPACLQPNINDGFNPGEKVEGKLSGFGEISNGTYPTVLLTAHLPFISYDECLKVLREDFIGSLSVDKFCAGSETGAGARAGDSGGGLLFVDEVNGLYYLRGVVSNRDSRGSSIASFTDVAQYTHWISRVIKSVERKSNDVCGKLSKTLEASDCVVTYKCTILNETDYNDTAVYCGLDIDTGAAKICCPKKYRRIVEQETRKDPNSIVWEKCTQYSSARYVNRIITSGNQNQPNITSRNLDCVTDEPFAPGRTDTKIKEFPHMALIGFTDRPEMPVNDSRWECIGSLISDRYVLTVAHCIGRGFMPTWVRLGELIIDSDNDAAAPRDFRIAEQIVYPQYTRTSAYFDIALLKLQDRVTFTPHIRPICLYTSAAAASTSNDKVLISGWGPENTGEQATDHLWKARNSLADNKKCIAYYRMDSKLVNGFDPISMVCSVGNASGETTCAGDSGGPLQMPIPNWRCMYWQVGIMSYGPVLCNQKDAPEIFTRVSYFIPWIQSIVWP